MMAAVIRRVTRLPGLDSDYEVTAAADRDYRT